MFLFYSSNFTFIFSLISLSSFSLSDLSLFSLIVFLTFAVKLPIYGLHFWLPMAHVEAPTFGSIILAGVLLKLGGVGLIRTSFLYDISFVSQSLLSYFMVFTIFVTLVCCFQADFKRLVAFSSVSHMITIPFMVLASTYVSIKGLVIVILFHGLSSPIIFMLVGLIYSLFQTRQLILIRGILLIRPLLSFILISAFFFTLSAPPFPSFIGEVLFMLSSFYLSPSLIPVFLIFAFFSLVYNLN
jgi:NADH-quinone oxidoreductase subunit M